MSSDAGFVLQMAVHDILKMIKSLLSPHWRLRSVSCSGALGVRLARLPGDRFGRRERAFFAGLIWHKTGSSHYWVSKDEISSARTERRLSVQSEHDEMLLVQAWASSGVPFSLYLPGSGLQPSGVVSFASGTPCRPRATGQASHRQR